MSAPSEWLALEIRAAKTCPDLFPCPAAREDRARLFSLARDVRITAEHRMRQLFRVGRKAAIRETHPGGWSTFRPLRMNRGLLRRHRYAGGHGGECINICVHVVIYILRHFDGAYPVTSESACFEYHGTIRDTPQGRARAAGSLQTGSGIFEIRQRRSYGYAGAFLGTLILNPPAGARRPASGRGS